VLNPGSKFLGCWRLDPATEYIIEPVNGAFLYTCFSLFTGLSAAQWLSSVQIILTQYNSLKLTL